MGGEANSRQQKEDSEAVWPTEGGRRSRAGEFFPPCPWGQPRSGGGERGEASATKRKRQPSGCRIFRLVDYGIEKSEYLLKSEAIITSLEKIVEFWDYWQEHGVGTILTLLSLFPIVVFIS